MNRLFEALSDIDIVQPSDIPRAAAPHVEIELNVERGALDAPMSADQIPTLAVSKDVPPADIASPIAALLAESDQVSTAVLLQDMFPTGMSRLFLALQAGVDQMAVEAGHVDVPPIDLDSPIAGSQAETEISAPGTVPPELSPAELDALIRALQAEVDQFTSVPVAPNAPTADLGTQIPSSPAETEMSAPETVPPDLSPAEMDSLILAQLAEVVQISSVPASPDVPPDVAPQIPPLRAQADQISTETVSPTETQTETTPPVPELQAESEQPSIVPVFLDLAVTDSISADLPDVRSAPSEPAQEVAPTRNSAAKPAELAAGRRVSIRLPAESRLVALTKPEGLGAEKFRALVTRLENHHKLRELKSFQVTSSVISEGKTLVSANIAVTLAKHFGAKTLLVEGDLHRPTLAPLFGLHRMRGLSHWWSGRDQGLGQFIHGLDELPLWFLPAGEPCDRASDILRSARFVRAFEELASQFEWIVVDSTPMTPIVDVNLWSRLLDGTLLVVREGVAPLKALKQGLLALDHPNLIGMVLNEASATSNSKYDGQYYGSSKRK